MENRIFKWSCRALAGVIFVLAIALSSVFAQRIAGGIRGKVTDIHGNPLADVKIILFDMRRGTKIRLKTDKNGNFFRRGLYASLYEATYQLEGFGTIKTRIEITRDRTPNQEIVLVKFDTKDLAINNFEIGDKLFNEGKYHEAIAIFQLIIEDVPDYHEAYYSMALCYIKINELDKAIPYLEKVMELKPDFAPNYLALGQIYSEKGKADEAIKYYSKAAELQPDNPQIYFKMGIAYSDMQKFDKAVEVLEKSINLDASNAYSYYHLGFSYRKLKNSEKMIENFEKFLQIKPDAPEASQIKKLIMQAKEQLSKQKREN